MQDGSGFAYSNYYFIDTVEDKYLPGTPIRVRVDEEMSVKKIRQMAREKAAPLIDKYALDDSPGVILAYNPVSEYDSNPHVVRYFGNLSNPPRLGSYTLKLTEKEFPAPEECVNMIGVLTGFSLSFTEQDSQAVNKPLYADQSVPKSRNCPNSYRIGAIIGNSEIVAPQIAMVLVASYGFEGNDERWLAIPLNPDKPAATP